VPDTLALDDGLAAGDDAADDAGADEDDEDEDELQAAAVRPRQPMPSTAATRLVDDRNVSMMSTLATATCVSQ
jgi:hypothetical protein